MAVTRELRLALGLWVCLAGWGLGRAACPAKCRCSGRRVECEGLEGTELRSLAEALPRATLSLALRHGDLRSLGGLCCLPQLQHLDVSDNRLGSALTFAAFPRLTHLSLQRNALKSLRKDEFASFPALRVLRLDGNLVENVDSDSLRLLHLRHLSLAQNRLRYVHQRTFRWTPRLEVLNLTGNRLTGLLDRNFYFLSGLRRLELEDNGLRHFTAESLQPLPNLETLSLGRNNISALPSGAFRSLRSLRSLSLHSNPLRVLDSGAFEDIPRLQTLVLRNSSRLELVLGGAFSGLGALERVDLSGCEALAFVSPAAFRSTPLLSSLLLNSSRGSLRSLPGPLVGRAGMKELRLPDSLDCACLASLARSQGPRLTNLLGVSTLPCTKETGEEAAEGSSSLPKVIRWGGRWTRNTCPIDNLLTLIWARAQRDASLVTKLGASLDERVLRGVLDELALGRPDEAKLAWAQHLVETDIPSQLSQAAVGGGAAGGRPGEEADGPALLDLHGREQDHFLSHFDASTLAMELLAFCPRCGSTAAVKTASQYLRIPGGEGVGRGLQGLLGGQRVAKEEEAGLACCGRRRRLSQRLFRSQSPWMLALEAGDLPTSAIRDFPASLSVDGMDFAFAGLTLYSADKRHFAAFLPWAQGRTFFYDGDSAELLQEATDDVVQDVAKTYSPNFALYLLSDNQDPVRSIRNLFPH